ncbi:MAG: hypothetical protein KF799_03165 [Bdellovibrionales bacterium]|nr:hypothetical protein [Bdellovibrionales bacterium]
MGFFYWFRVGMMVVALAGIIMVMRELNAPQYPGKKTVLARWFGPDENVAGVNLCPTRVTRLETGKVAVFQEGMEWYRTTDAHKEHLDPVAVEKWFSRNCAQQGEKTSASADVKEALKVHFVSGEPQVLLKSASGEFEWMGKPFRSVQMDTAVEELSQLPLSTKRK